MVNGQILVLRSQICHSSSVIFNARAAWNMRKATKVFYHFALLTLGLLCLHES